MRQSRWFALFACGFVAVFTSALGQGWDPAALVGQWRKNTTIYESVQDEHLVLHGDGTSAVWYRKAASQGHVLAREGLEDLTKLDMRRLSRLQRISSNIIARMDELAKEAIRSIK